MDNLGIADKIIENLNLIDMAAKGCINQRVVKVHFLEGDSRGCLGGDEWVWLQVGSTRTEDEKLLSYPFYEKYSEQTMPCVFYIFQMKI